MTLDAVGRLLGRLHPTMVHFPIALLIVAAATEVGRALRRRPGPSPASLVCFGFGAAGAAAAAGMGWLNAAYEEAGNSSWVLTWHRWLGVSIAGLSALLTVAAWRASRGRGALRLYRVGLVVAAMLVAVGGHFGGMLTHGNSYITDAVLALWSPPEATVRVAPPPPPSPSAEGPPAPAGPIDFEARVRPILAQNCYSCHGPKKRKGGLRLDLADEADKGGKSGPVIIPGDAGASTLIKRITSQDPETRMPLDEEALPQDQIQVLIDWVLQGAPWAGAEPRSPP